MNSILALIGRDKELFKTDINFYQKELSELVKHSSFLVLGGAGSIGQAVTKEIFKRSPKKLHVVDLSENNLVELVRDIRSSLGYIEGDFRTFALDIGSMEYKSFIKSDGKYDYVLNLSALKHVRSEKDPYTLMRMIKTNISNTNITIEFAEKSSSKKYFCVSTDKAANPANLMGASKRIMEMFLMRYSEHIPLSMARFANVAFSDGSLLHGFNQRILKRQPIVAPNDVRRYFVTPKESGELCLMSCLLGENRDIFFPKLSDALHLITFSEIALRFLEDRGFEPVICESEEQARELVSTLPKQGKWPCLFTRSDTTGEKDFEEFFTEKETLDMQRFNSLGVIKNKAGYEDEKLNYFTTKIETFYDHGSWDKAELIELFRYMIPNLAYQDNGKYLDSKM